MFKILTFVAIAATIVFVVLWWMGGPGAKRAFSRDEYRVSDEIIDPYKIVNNPYLLEGHSGILDTVSVAVLSNGMRGAYPGGNLRFDRMIDEHTASYDVIGLGAIGEQSVGEIEVKLPDSNPPDSLRQWRVFMEQPEKGVNGFGGPLTLTVLSFEGYYVPAVSQTNLTPEPSYTDPNPTVLHDSNPQTIPTQEVPAQPAVGNPAVPMAPSSEAPVLVTRSPGAPVAQHFKWQTESNGDETLRGVSGICATMHLSLDGTNRLRATFSDGTSKDFAVDQTADAMQASMDFCRATDGSTITVPN